MRDVMDSRIAIFVAIAVIASAIALPGIDGADSDSEIFTYYELLDANGKLVYKEVSSATSIDKDTKEFVVELTDSLCDDTDEAKAYADRTVREALTALYLSNPMIPYIWDYPVKDTQVEPEITIVKVTRPDGTESTHYVVSKVTFSLTVPEGITSDSMKELNEALKDFEVSGSTDADKVKNIMSELDKVYFHEDEEGTISNIYSALVKKQTTSAGVAQAFVALCKLNNIPVITVSGTDLLATNEPGMSYWNYVYLEGDVDGETVMSWYIVDPTYAVSTGIAGYLTEVSYDGKTYSMSSAHYVDLGITGEVSLQVPQLAKEKYVPVGGIPFLEQWGEAILIIAIGVVMIGSMFYAMRKDII